MTMTDALLFVLGAVVLALGVDLAALPPGAPATTVWALRPPRRP